MVYLTGDTHGDIQRFKQGKLRWLGKKDTVVVLGDFGFVWDGSAAERKRLDWLRKRPYTILFLDGSHEKLRPAGTVPGDGTFRRQGAEPWRQRIPCVPGQCAGAGGQELSLLRRRGKSG